MHLYDSLLTAKQNNEKKFVVLIDPDKVRLSKLDEILYLSKEVGVDYFFIGGSLIVNDMLDDVLKKIKTETHIPSILFPGSSLQISYQADAILFLSLISGRNADLLIGKHVETAPFLKISPLEVIPTGYMLIDGGSTTSVQYISNTNPIPAVKNDIATATAVAGELLGLKLIYMDAGSGAKNPISTEMISSVSSAINVPLIVGGGINSPEKVKANIDAGADVIVVGNAIEKEPSLIKEMADIVHNYSTVKA